MKSFRVLFEQYSKGTLADDKVEELNRQLIGIYFNSPGELNKDELEYTEDLVFELFAGDNLDEAYYQQLKEKLDKDHSLHRKYILLKNLSNASQSAKKKRFHLAVDTEADEQEEAELKEVLQEVIEKVHTEREATPAEPVLDNFFIKLKAFFRDLIPPINFAQPQVKFAMVAVSIFIIAYIVWITVDPEPKEQIAYNEVSDTIQNKQFADIDSANLLKEIEHNQIAENEIKDSIKDFHIAETEASKHKEEWEIIELDKQERLSNLIAANYVTPEFEHTLLRNQTSDANDLFIRAGENYKQEDYDSCIFILNDLLTKKYFKNPDTLNEIHFYLGNSYLTKGLKEKRKDLVELSLSSFKEVDAVYFQKEVKWYSVIALLELGRNEESLKLINELIQYNYPENIGAFRDSVMIILDE
ncbi:MAG: hypothetical protein K8S16_21740 [Bacteroidales bacterium]|nr:hypothetical protein [Bacteroidales bacterium]